MSDLLTIKNQVIRAVKRSDLDDLIVDEINAGIQLIARSVHHPYDLVESTLTDPDIDETANNQSVTLPTGFRTIAYLDYADTDDGLPLDPLDLSSGFSREMRFKTDVYYISGSNLIFRNSKKTSSFILGYYKFLDRLVNDTDTNWVVTQFQDVLVRRAASVALSIIGASRDANAVRGISEQELVVYIQDSVQTQMLNHRSGRR